MFSPTHYQLEVLDTEKDFISILENDLDYITNISKWQNKNSVSFLKKLLSVPKPILVLIS